MAVVGVEMTIATYAGFTICFEAVKRCAAYFAAGTV